jgi:hypothetical protein
MGNSIEGVRAVAHGIVAVEIRVVVTAAAVIVVAIGVRVITPARIAGADKEGGGEIAPAVSITVSVTGAVGSAHRRIIRIIGA